jgi:SAM-dependent methyltransferase
MSDADTFRQRLYERYATTQGSRGRDLQAVDASRRPYLDRLIRRYFPGDRDARILDIGCGDGFLLQALRAHGYAKVRGVDTSAEQVALAQSRGIDVMQGDILAALTDCPAGSLDVVVAFDVLEHLSKLDALRVAEHAFRVLRERGRLLVHVPNGAALFGAQTFFSDLTHETCFTGRSMRQLMNVAGFPTTEIAEDTPTVHGVKSAVRWLLWQVLRNGAYVARAVETGGGDGSSVFSQNLLAIAYK